MKPRNPWSRAGAEFELAVSAAGSGCAWALEQHNVIKKSPLMNLKQGFM